MAACPECGSAVDVTYRAAQYLDKLGLWEGIEDCRKCSTALGFSVQIDEERLANIKCERL